MTISYPDLSNYDGKMSLLPGTVAVCAKVSEGTGFADSTYAWFKYQAAAVGALFSGYHFLHQGDGAGQGTYARRLAGLGVPLMVDCEPTGVSVPTVQDCLDFYATASKGGPVWGCYLPQWYWSTDLGKPDLAPLSAVGMALVASNYAPYSDTGAGWQAYGGVAPQIWQYTDSYAYGGDEVDFNAYRGTVAQLAQLWGIASMGTIKKRTDMALIIRVTGQDGVYLLDGGRMHLIIDPVSLQSYMDAGVPQGTVSAPELAALLRDYPSGIGTIGTTVPTQGTAVTGTVTGTLTLTPQNPA